MTIREASLSDAGAIAGVHVASWQTTYPGIVPQEAIDNLTVEERTRRWMRPLSDPQSKERVYVAEDEAGQIVGFACGGPERQGTTGYDSELYSIYLVKDTQRKGTGRRLVAAVARRFADDGMKAMMVCVLRENPSRHFYEALGGKPIASSQIVIGGKSLDEVAYGWPDITQLFGNP